MTTHTPLRCANSAMIQRGTNEVVLMDTGNYPSYSNFLNQTWTWNGTDWTNTGSTLIDAAGPLPGRTDMVLAYDGTNVVLFGGRGASETDGMFEDTWTWNGTAWSKKSPATSPVGRFGAEAAYLSGTGTVLFGGTNASNSLYPDTWIWNGSTWSTLALQATGPAARRGHVMAASTTQVIMFGGENINQQMNDTWSFAASTWTKLSPTTSPTVRSGACMSYDTVNNIWVMFGGRDEYNYLPETWYYTAGGTNNWTQVSVAAGAGPTGRIGAQMCFDTHSGKSIMFGGYNATDSYASNETWAFSGSAKTWTKL